MKKQIESAKEERLPDLYPVKTKIRVTIIVVITLFIYIGSMYWMQNQVVGDYYKTFTNVNRVIKKFFPPDLSIIFKVWRPLILTVQMAIISTTIATLLAIPLTLLSSNNIVKSKFIYFSVRTCLSVLRTIPDLLLAVLFIGLFGVGVFSGILALTIFSFCILTKLMSEKIESINMNSLEAVRATGGNLIHLICKALVPQVVPQFLSYVLYVFEINIRASIVLGVIGVGGIGRVLDRELGFYNYQNVMAIIIVIIIIVMAIEWLNKGIRKMLV